MILAGRRGRRNRFSAGRISIIETGADQGTSSASVAQMTHQVLAKPTPQSEEECRAAFHELMAEIGRMIERMDTDREEINRLRAEQDELRSRTRDILASMGYRL